MHIKTDGHIEKATRLKEGEVEFVVSTNALDSHGEKINIDGIDFKEYKKNPVVLWGHDGFNLPIARTKKIWREGNKLMAKAEFYLKDNFAKKIYDYIIDGFLSAVSIGGMVKEWSEDGITIEKLQMKEFSVVSIGANPQALVANKQFNKEQIEELNGLANAYARKIIAEKGGTSLQKDVETLEKLTTTLRELVFNEPQEVKNGSLNNNTTRVCLKQAQMVDTQVEKVIKTIKLKGNHKNE